jgi:hypothetical protein
MSRLIYDVSSSTHLELRQLQSAYSTVLSSDVRINEGEMDQRPDLQR